MSESHMSELIEQFLRAAMRAHHLSDFCQECRRTGKEIATRQAQGIRHHCMRPPA